MLFLKGPGLKEKEDAVPSDVPAQGRLENGRGSGAYT